MRFILLRGLGWTKAGAPVKCGAFEEVLPVRTRQGGQHGQD